MKNKLLLVLVLLGLAFAKAQNPHTTMIPATATQMDQVILEFDATGTVFENTNQTLYAHTGVTFNGMDWDFVKAPWATTGADITFVNTAPNIYQLDLGMSINQYYGIAGGNITHITMVVRNANGSQQISPDEYIPVFLPGLNVAITNPTNNEVFNINETITVQGTSSQNTSLSLNVNNTNLVSTTATSVSTPYTFAAPGTYVFQLFADNGTDTSTDEVSVFVPGTTPTGPRPAGAKNGINENADGSVTFVLAANGKNNVSVIGNFNNWNLSNSNLMTKDGDYFWLTVPASEFTAGDVIMYQYLVDFDIRVADPFSQQILDPGSDQFIKAGNYPNLPAYPSSDTTGDVTFYTYQDTPYSWTTNNFVRPDKENLVIYEILPRDFSEGDSYQAIIDRIDYLEELGINALQFMPLNEFEGTDSWGYNPKLHGALDKAYGTPDKLKELIDLCHSKGIAVILDIVYNHAFSQSPLNQMWWDSANSRPAADNPYLNVTARHPFNVGDDFNHDSAFTREYVKQTMEFFLEEYRFDGFRFDLSKGFTQRNSLGNQGLWDSYDQDRIDVLNEYKNNILNNPAFGSDVYMILEHLGSAGEETRLANDGFMLWGKMTDQFNQNSMGYSNDSDVFRSYHTSRNFADKHLVAYAESHDEQRLMYKNLEFGNSTQAPGYDVKDLDVALDRQEALAAILYSIPGPKMLWQFGELGYEIDIDQNGRTGRKPIPWTLGYDQDQDRMDLYRATATFINFKTLYPETFNSENNNLNIGNSLQKQIWLDGPVFDAVVVANFSVTPQSVPTTFTQGGTWYDYFSNNSTINVTNPGSTSISLAPGEYKLFTTQALNSPLSNEDQLISDIETLRIFPNPSTGSFSVSQEVESLQIVDMTGKLVKKFAGPQRSYDISDLRSGIYLVALSTGTTLKLIKK
ncbi:MAG: alpha-amylase family glycosyl hydrolase [Nonlabens sp.]